MKETRLSRTEVWVKRMGTAVLIALVLLVAALPGVRADESPKPIWNGAGNGSNALFFQTTGKQVGAGNCNDGNWLTCESGVDGDHFYEIYVPCDWPTGVDFQIDIFSPWMTTSDDSTGGACNQATANSVCNIDEDLPTLASVPATTFALWGPGNNPTVDLFGSPQITTSGAAVQDTTYAAVSTDHAWVRYATLDMSDVPNSCGRYVLQEEVDWTGNERNGFALRTGYDNDSDPTNTPPADYANPGNATAGTPIGLLGVEPEWGGPRDPGTIPDGSLCLNYSYRSGPPSVQPTVSFYFFDLDYQADVTYTAPDGTIYTTSATNASGWNGSGGTDTTDVATVLASTWDGVSAKPGIGDHFINPQAGVWDVELCMSTEDHYYFSGPFGEPISASKEPPGAIGNYVWVDENGDGVQDAGEPGIPGVTVELYNNNGDLVDTTVTDANGGYIFTEVALGTYTVKVDTSTLPAGLAANPTYDEDGGGDSEIIVLLAAGAEHMTADFGYNWSDAPGTDNPPNGALGAIGDRVWIDANSDGVQDANEAGLAGVGVILAYDGDGDGVLDEVYATTETDAFGNYIFDELPAGSYNVIIAGDGDPALAQDDPVPAAVSPTGYTNTGDPEGNLNDQTDTPIVLGPGDVYLNADFGYNLDAGGSTIGDTIYFDADANGSQGGGEPGIPGVTVALLDGSGNVLATTITDEDGKYSFPGLPNGSYQVVVTDTNNVLGELVASGNPPGDGLIDQIGPVIVISGSNNLNQDFGFTPPLHDNGEGLIGDTIFLDRNNNDTPDPGEGLEGVTVDLYDSFGTTLLATTTTDENGNYSFGNLNPTGTYVVRVDTATLPPGLTNSFDPDGGADSSSIVDLDATGPIDLDQDFGYQGTNSLAGTVWEDSSADGVFDGGETDRFGGVTVALLDSLGNVVATTTTASDGTYSFQNLPNGNYIVDVTDDANVLNGYWHSLGVDSEPDPTAQIALSGGTNVTGVDFGYYIDPAALGDFVWFDNGLGADGGNGIQDPGEPGVPGVLVTLTITYPNGDVSTITTLTGPNGEYNFGNLLLDEDYNGVSGSPTFEIMIDLPVNTIPTLINQGDGSNDSDDPAGVTAVPLQGELTDVYDFGLVVPDAVGLSDFSAAAAPFSRSLLLAVGALALLLGGLVFGPRRLLGR